MRILTRYLLKSHVGPFVFALATLTGILFVNTIARRFENLAGKGLEASVILEVFALSLPHILALTLPMAVLVSVLYAFSQLAGDNEITALKASGTNLIRMIMPLVFVAFLFALGMVWFNDRVLPDANSRLKALTADIGAKTPTLMLTEQVVSPIQTGDYQEKYWIRPGRIEDDTKMMYEIVIYDMSESRVARTVYADSGHMTLNPDQTDLMLTLYDGVVHESNQAEPAQLQRTRFTQQRIEMKGVGTKLRRNATEYRSDREMSVAMLRGVVDSARMELATLRSEGRRISMAALERMLAGPARTPGTVPPPSSGRFDTDLVSLGDVRDMADVTGMADIGDTAGADETAYRAALDAQRIANNAQASQDRINQYRVEIHKKFAIPFACIIFVLIGAPLAVRFPRGGVGMVIAASLSIFGIYYMSLIGGEKLADRGIIAPFWGPWAPNLLFGSIAAWALSRIGRETATSRGGGFDDLWVMLRGIFTGGFLRRRRSTDLGRAHDRTADGELDGVETA
ncbi:MAG TPA: LptF/LptG family permease [Longimicrobiales bacterium]|nr:LptF/LptG family permease [Longimicrobiales bacterium]